jgi:predicted nucleic acid-binding protein
VTTYYLDASVWTKRYSQERGSEQVLLLFEQGNILACATLGFVETCAAVARKLDGPAAEAAKIALDQIAGDWKGFIRIQLTDQIADQAAESAARWKLRGADAVHLASALYLRRRLGGDDETCFVCADERLTAVAQQAGLEVMDPGRPPQTQSQEMPGRLPGPKIRKPRRR